MAAKTDERVEAFQASYLPRLVVAYHPTRVLLFGSQARGTAIEQSDLDLVVVSQAFERIPFIQRAHQVLWTMRSPFAIEILCYTPEEFERKRKEIGIARIAAEEGVDLLSENRDKDLKSIH